MDRSSAAGLIGAAAFAARSFMPNLLTRRTADQAVITGITSATAYGVFSAGDAILDAAAARLSRSESGSTVGRLAVALAVGGAGVAAARALAWREHEEPRRAVGRLAAQSAVAVSAASALSTVARGVRPSANAPVTVAVAAVVGAASYALARPWQARPGSLLDEELPGSVEFSGQYFFEDTVRQVSPAKTLGIATGVAAATYGIARAESRITSAVSSGATRLVGGEPEDHRMLGRLANAAINVGAVWFAVTRVSSLLSKGGGSIEPAYADPPQAPEITGSPASGLPWHLMTREGARWLAATLPPAAIDEVMGTSTAMQPIRVYASLDIAESDEHRAQVLLGEIDRTKALERKHFALFSPTGSGYVNYVANETFEYLTGGNCASVAIQYSVLPSALSLNRVTTGTDQTAMVMHGIVDRLLDMPKAKRPKIFLFGESLGSQVSEEMFAGTGIFGLAGTDIEAAVWIGTPSATRWRKELWGDRTIAEPPQVGPGAAYLPRSVSDWRALPEEERAQVRYLLLQNGDDPIPKFWAPLAWRRPDWLGPEQMRPIGAPRGTHWVAGMTFLTTFFDMQNALSPTPGTFSEGGHDYRHVLPEAISQTWRLPATAEQMERMNAALRARELAWEMLRDWTEAESKPVAEQAKAKAKVLAKASSYTGTQVNEAGVQALIEEGLHHR
jgi:uncharacterized membrane protein